MKRVTKTPDKGYLLNCYLMRRPEDEVIFNGDKEGRVIAMLDGYAIIPREEYNRLKELVGEEPLRPVERVEQEDDGDDSILDAEIIE